MNTTAASVPMPIRSNAAGRINRIAAKIGAKTYLEIGVAWGNTFVHVQVPCKTAVDPHFQFDTGAFSRPGTFFVQATSNAFFAHLPQIQQKIYGRKLLYDLVYIDGLHTFEQAMGDFINSLYYSHAGTVWVFDDTVPCDPWSALASNALNQSLRKLAGVKGAYWSGDVYKCIFALYDHFQEYSWCTQLDSGYPQTVVWKTAQPSRRQKLFPNLTGIKNLSYFDMLEKCYVLNPVQDKEILAQIGKNFVVSDTNASQYWDKMVKPIGCSGIDQG